MSKRKLTNHELEMLGRIAGVLFQIQKSTELLLDVAREMEGELVQIGLRLSGADERIEWKEVPDEVD